MMLQTEFTFVTEELFCMSSTSAAMSWPVLKKNGHSFDLNQLFGPGNDFSVMFSGVAPSVPSELKLSELLKVGSPKDSLPAIGLVSSDYVAPSEIKAVSNDKAVGKIINVDITHKKHVHKIYSLGQAEAIGHHLGPSFTTIEAVVEVQKADQYEGIAAGDDVYLDPEGKATAFPDSTSPPIPILGMASENSPPGSTVVTVSLTGVK